MVPNYFTTNPRQMDPHVGTRKKGTNFDDEKIKGFFVEIDVSFNCLFIQIF